MRNFFLDLKISAILLQFKLFDNHIFIFKLHVDIPLPLEYVEVRLKGVFALLNVKIFTQKI